MDHLLPSRTLFRILCGRLQWSFCCPKRLGAGSKTPHPKAQSDSRHGPLRLPHSRRGAENQGFSGLLGGDAQEPEVGEGNDEVGAYHQDAVGRDRLPGRSEEHTSELQSLMRLSYAVLCLKKK